MDKTVYVVHSVDSEGPLYESIEARFELMQNLFGITGIVPTHENFRRVMAGEIDVGPNGDVVRKAFSGHRTRYMETWEMLDAMVTRVTSPVVRNRVRDSFGGGYVFNWFCLDHVDFVTNPRRRAMGYHAVFDYYREVVRRSGNKGDGLHWHFHPMSTYREAHRCATSLLNSPHVVETLARRILERGSFPACVRCGFQSERPDVHWFLEQYVPFDFTNTALDDQAALAEMETQLDLANGRFGDWRLAPKDWSVYQPSHDCYQLPGTCRRWIARSLNIKCRFGNLDARETEKAFARAARGWPTLMGIATHDFRDLEPEMEELCALVLAAQAKHPDVRFKFSEAREAMRAVVYGNCLGEPLELALELERDAKGRPRRLAVRTVRGHVFGPQPFLALKTRGKRVLHDNLDFDTDLKCWRYVFDVETVVPEDLAAVGVGANDRFGNTVVKSLRLDG